VAISLVLEFELVIVGTIPTVTFRVAFPVRYPLSADNPILVDWGRDPAGITGAPEIIPVDVSILNPEGSGIALNDIGDLEAVIV